MRRLLRSRIFQFTAAGTALFLLAPSAPRPDRIALSTETLTMLAEAEARRRGAAGLTPALLAEVRQRTLEDEILYREALRLGLDRNDPVVRQRLIQKVLLIAEERGFQPEPTEAALQAHLDAHRARFPGSEVLRWVHTFSRTREAAAALPVEAHDGERPPPLGDGFALSRAVGWSRPEAIEREYGGDFARAVAATEPGRWSGPIASRFGWHRVFVQERRSGGPPALAEVRQQVLFDLLASSRRKAHAAFLTEAFSRYRIALDGETLSLAAVRQPPAEPGGPR